MTTWRSIDLTIERSANRPIAAPTNAAATTPIATEMAAGANPVAPANHGITGSSAPNMKQTKEIVAAWNADGSSWGSIPSSSRVWTRNAVSGDVMTSSAAARAVSGEMPWLSYIDASSAVSAAALRASSRRSTATSRCTSSFCADTLIHSPAAIEMPPAIAPASPARRTMDESAPEPAKPRMSDTFDTSPSLMPNTAARARPPDTERWPPWSSSRVMVVTLPGAESAWSLRPTSPRVR